MSSLFMNIETFITDIIIIIVYVPTILTTLKCDVWIAAVCACIYIVMQTVGKRDKRKEKRYYWLYFLEMGCIYMSNLY